jgi:hydroxymethylglutaryl-CoA lyase
MVPKSTLTKIPDAIEIIKPSNEFLELSGCVLVPNLKGAQLAFDASAKKLNFVLSADEPHYLENIKMTIDQSLKAINGIISIKIQISKHARQKLSVRFQHLMYTH